MRPERIVIPGPVAEDKDKARSLRVSKLLPALRAGRPVLLDFSRVVTATQSFLHALLSEALRTHGEEVLENIDFHNCSKKIKNLITTVVEYSLRARTLTQEGLSGKLRKTDVPQADNLQMIRAVLDALASGSATPEDIANTNQFSLRHVHYRLHAARVLGFVRFGKNIASLTERGRRLVAVPHQSDAERNLLIAAITESATLKKLCPNLLDRKAPTIGELTRRLEQKTGLSRATAARRAQSLLSWRRALLGFQVALPGILQPLRVRGPAGTRSRGM